MAHYVDGFVVPVPLKNLDAYRAMAELGGKVMEDPRMKSMMESKTMPFDGMRMFWGGFKSFVGLGLGPVAAR